MCVTQMHQRVPAEDNNSSAYGPDAPINFTDNRLKKNQKSRDGAIALGAFPSRYRDWFLHEALQRVPPLNRELMGLIASRRLLEAEHHPGRLGSRPTASECRG